MAAATMFRNTLLAASRAATRQPARATTTTVMASSRRCFTQSTTFLVKRYTESHEWIDIDPSTRKAKIGISRHAAETLGEIVYVELPGVGDELTAGEPFGAIESVKAASDLVTPVSGAVAAVQAKFADEPQDLGKDPEDEGSWLVEVEGVDEGQAEGLMSAEEYATFAEDH
ncbi:hypothetical protein N3K66_000037 [Trichothecium roseum]|uniref:Uncharacterized protein n=1 Tax=Trichothecium roseum TaxID=47278 RepID=A0ACC0VBK5_9HYPO|nr:hypothetical protein N3K66_000037 [Trichothecium roseum]